MLKEEFLNLLAARLHALPAEEIEKSLAYYGEMIDDRMEDGDDEETAVASLGAPDKLVAAVLYAQSLTTLAMGKLRESKEKAPHKGLWTALMLLGSPLWLPLLLAGVLLILALYVVLWSLILALYASLLAVGLTAGAFVVGGGIFFFTQSLGVALCTLGAGVFAGGVAILLARPMWELGRSLLRLTAALARRLKSYVIGGAENA